MSHDGLYLSPCSSRGHEVPKRNCGPDEPEHQKTDKNVLYDRACYTAGRGPWV
ncbi:hypothetical protein CDL15_Pgr000950 [Punica granatum]|uniref:Uncharacterized protein n=1 Tax=Punica granatum TaxID=22663 RepID=A0A218XIB3_PUNGR|nr:hypothetical protein CDL15_Pgr000950 [Punica granatum]